MKQYSDKPRALVTGGAGFLGSHLCDRLLATGRTVICLDNFFTGTRANVQHLAGNPDFEVIRHDVTMPIKLEIDEIYNLACPASPPHYQYNPIDTTMTSVLGARNTLELAREKRATILHASTSEVYGDPTIHPQPETYWGNVNPIGVRSCYDEGKRVAETLFFDYHRVHGVDIRVARIFNTFGPRMHRNDGRVVSNFIIQALSGKDITIYGDGSQTRSFCYVDDLISAFLAMMADQSGSPEPLNIGNPAELTMIQLAETIIAMTGSRSKLAFRPLPSDDPKQRRPDISRVTARTGWAPTVSVEQGLERTIQYFRGIV